MAIRTFLALDLEETIRGALVEAVGGLPEAGSKIRWVAPANLHVTVKFLGDVAEGDVDAVCGAVAEAAGRGEPFDFDVVGLRCIPAGGRLRMIWAGVREPTGRFDALFGQLESALTPLGFEPERRKFSPHVTLARVKSAPNAGGLRAAAGAHAETRFGTQRAAEVTVYSSRLTPDGPIYTPMARPRIGPA